MQVSERRRSDGMFGKKIAPIHFPIRENEKFTGYVNVVKKVIKKWLERPERRMSRLEYLDEYLENIEKLCWKQLQRQAMSLWIAILQEKSSPCMRS